MNVYDTRRYAYLDAGWSDKLRTEDVGRASGSGLMIVDLTDPAGAKQVSTCHVPGQMIGEEN